MLLLFLGILHRIGFWSSDAFFMVFQTRGVPGIHSDKPEGTYDKDKFQKKTSQTDQLCNSSQFLGALQRIIKD